jgi:copper chaperone CopZ
MFFTLYCFTPPGEGWVKHLKKDTEMEIKLEVKGMTCGHCTSGVEKALAAVPGVETVVEVNKDTERAVVVGTADAATLVAAVIEEGYEAKAL